MEQQDAALINIKLKVQRVFLNLYEIMSFVMNFGTDAIQSFCTTV